MLESRKRIAAPPVPAANTMYEQKKAEIEAKRLAAAAAGQPAIYDVYMKLTGIAGTDVQVSQFMSSCSRASCSGREPGGQRGVHAGR